MKTEEELRGVYRSKRQELEEQLNAIYQFRQKGEKIAQQTYEEISYHVRQREEDYTEVLGIARQEIEYLETAFQEGLRLKEREVGQKEEANEEHFRNELQRLERSKK
ncbi:hypothetical protein [Listeria sp. ILCC792]|uniref:hypothetical protein n=1 Tax=Listeria sp. ILCC792 TaxID=1918331 RepID=UPI000B58D3E8|nr:hypothetical protein [Listeria sp. ILCC792]